MIMYMCASKTRLTSGVLEIRMLFRNMYIHTYTHSTTRNNNKNGHNESISHEVMTIYIHGNTCA